MKESRFESFSVPVNVVRGQEFLFTGRLVDAGTGVGLKKVITVHKAETGEAISGGYTDDNGLFAFQWTEYVYGDFRYYAYFPQDADYYGAQSTVALLRVAQPSYETPRDQLLKAGLICGSAALTAIIFYVLG